MAKERVLVRRTCTMNNTYMYKWNTECTIIQNHYQMVMARAQFKHYRTKTKSKTNAYNLLFISLLIYFIEYGSSTLKAFQLLVIGFDSETQLQFIIHSNNVQQTNNLEKRIYKLYLIKNLNSIFIQIQS